MKSKIVLFLDKFIWNVDFLKGAMYKNSLNIHYNIMISETEW